jgi:membrane-bound ClpP family serine protease
VEWLIIIGLILTGIFLVVAEIIFIPGIFVAGAIGALLSIYGVNLAYTNFGDITGHIVLLGAIVGNVAGVVLSLRGKSWERFSLKETNVSKVNEVSLQIGDLGVTLSSLKPYGKALFGDSEVEVRSNGEFLEENTNVIIVNIESSRIFVNPEKQKK